MSIIKQVTLQKIVAHDFRYDPRSNALHYTGLCSMFWTVKVLSENAVVVAILFRYSCLLFFNL